MKASRSLALTLATLVCAGVSLAHAADPTTSGEASANTRAKATHAPLHTGTAAHASTAARTENTREAMAARAERVSIKARAHAESKLEHLANDVDQCAARGEAQVAGRLATDFSKTAHQVAEEKQQLGTSWGNLMIAQTLAANSSSGVTVQQLVEMRGSGMGWGEIAAGLGFNLGSMVSAVKAESRVATGVAKADGHVAMIRGERGHTGAQGEAGINAGLEAHHDHASLGAAAGVGAGGKIGR